MTSMAVSAPWYYKLEKHRPAYGSVILLFGMILASLAGHDRWILEDVIHGNTDIEALNGLYMHISDYSTVIVLGIIGLAAVIGGIAYVIIVAVAHRKIAKDSFPLG